MTYYAHSVAGQPETEWEPLARHLNEVADGARCRGQHFGADALAELAGLAHDLGKYGTDFQARVRGAATRANHSTAGAAWAAKCLPEKWGRLLAHVVAGHHAGLADDLFGPEGRIEAKSDLIGPAVRAAAADGIALPLGVEHSASRGTNQDRSGWMLSSWTKSADDILAAIQRFCHRTQQIGGITESGH